MFDDSWYPLTFEDGTWDECHDNHGYGNDIPFDKHGRNNNSP